MRRLASALLLALLVVPAGWASAPQPVRAAAAQTKVVIVVGATQGITASYRADANAMAAQFSLYTTNVIKIYSPNATWDKVAAAAVGANILVYLGHGTGWPNPYLSYFQPSGDNGMGLNASATGSDDNTKYYGEDYMAQLGLAPNALVILNHLCYAAGNSEWGRGKPTLEVAKTRIDGYASGFIRGGAKAVIAEGLNDLSYYIEAIFTRHTTIDDIFQSNPWFHHNLSTWASSRNAGYTSAMDPDLANPAPDGDVYYRSMVSLPSTTTDAIISGTIPPFVSKTGTYHPIAPTRVVDTRTATPGPLGKLRSIGAYSFPIAGKAGIPSNAIAITANLTVTNATAGGFVYLGPTIWAAPVSSTINFLAKDNRANGVTVPLSSTGFVAAWYRGNYRNASADVIIDVTGYYTADGAGYGYVKFGPYRLLDTRDGTGLAGKFETAKPRKIQVAGVAGLPATGIKAVVGNLTVVYPSQKGYAYLGPDATASPSSSTLNFPAGDIRANNFVVPVAADGTIGLDYASTYAGTADFVIDISGYFVAGSGAQYHTLNPTRILDSRIPTGLPGIVTGTQPQTLVVRNRGGVPAGAIAITANLTVTGQQAQGTISVGPTISPATPFSNLNFPVGDDRANGVTTPLALDGSVQLVYMPTASVTTHMILDVCGYYQ
jgi:hypothetical protein